MSISIYYEAKRRTSLNTGEISRLNEIAKKYSVDEKIEQYIATTKGYNWESFHYEVNVERGGLFKKGLVFRGSTKLPDNTENAMKDGIQHWCACLSDIRHSLPSCDWRVSVEDHEMYWEWDIGDGAYDTSK